MQTENSEKTLQDSYMSIYKFHLNSKHTLNINSTITTIKPSHQLFLYQEKLSLSKLE
jgi:hypothetical protein